jgi:hypothetical protein
LLLTGGNKIIVIFHFHFMPLTNSFNPNFYFAHNFKLSS